MRCYVPFCKNTSDDASTPEGEVKITFHSFPSEVNLRSAWLRALGKQGNLPDTAVVCSQHFLNDDIYETESGLKQIRYGAIPSTVQVCMICLDTGSKMVLMSKYKLEEAYQKLTGHPLCDQGNLKQTLCVQCAERLIDYSSFREKSLNTRALILDLVEKHELITRRHIEMLNRTKHQLKRNTVLTTLGPDHYALHTLEHPSEDKQIELDGTGPPVLVKIEGIDNVMSVDEIVELLNKDDSNGDSHKNGDGDAEFFTSSEVCKPHTAVSSSSSYSSRIIETKQADPGPSAYSAQTLVAPANEDTDAVRESQPIFEINNGNTSLTEGSWFTCEICPYKTKYLGYLKSHMRTHTGEGPIIYCMSCNYKCNQNSHLVEHMKIHTGEKPLSCKLCDYKCKRNSRLMEHMIIHTDEKPFSCQLCNYKCKRNSRLMEHMIIHTDEKPFSCQLCNYKCKRNSRLMEHMIIHTDERPFSCQLCNYQCKTNSRVMEHIRTHTGVKPFSCRLCDYKCAQRSSLVRHMMSHTGLRPYVCKLCSYKFKQNNHLVNHMRTHTGMKPFACTLCDYKCAQRSNLVRHMKTHTVVKPLSCTVLAIHEG